MNNLEYFLLKLNSNKYNKGINNQYQITIFNQLILVIISFTVVNGGVRLMCCRGEFSYSFTSIYQLKWISFCILVDLTNKISTFVVEGKVGIPNICF